MASLLAFSLLCLAFFSSLGIGSSRKMELKIKNTSPGSVLHPGNETSHIEVDPSKVIQLSWHPRAFLYKGFLSGVESDHLISLARDKMDKSLVTETDVGNSKAHTEIILARGEDEIVSKIEERLSAWTFLPKENGESMQILHHGINESLAPYYDYYFDRTKLVNGGHRVATVLIYLSSVGRGGETVFPNSELKGTQAKHGTLSDCAQSGYSVKPVRGDALLYFNLHPNVTTDENSLHGDCPVLEGEKWLAVKWIHVKAFDAKRPSSVSADGCTDEDDNCSNWAASGECQRNPVFMLGTPDYYGTCRKSCGVC